MKFGFILVGLSAIILSLFIFIVRADELADITKQLDDLKSALQSSQKATTTNEKELNKLNAQLNSIKARVGFLEGEIVKKEKEVQDGEKAFVYQKTLLDQRAVSYYKNLSKQSSGVVELLVTENLDQSLQNFFYQKTLQDDDRRTITKIVLYIKDLELKKTNLEIEKNKLSAVKQEVDKQSQFLAGEVTKSKTYESSLQNKIVELSVRQQQILSQRLSSLNIPQSAYTMQGGCVDDREKDPGFSPRIAFFTFGVPNRVGLNQYGAYGRAKAGQSYETILRAYYNFDELQDFDNININVEGYGSYPLEDYVKRIYEVPDNWGSNGGMEALKAQAIAARSYALAYTNKGAGSICTTEQCQVFQSQEKGGNWNSAVEATKGKAMSQGGNPIKAWFSSTHGGYIFSSGDIGWSGTSWTKNAKDTTDDGINSFGDLQSKAYDKDSPWFYCDWGSRAGYNKTAWLKQDEVADIANTLLLVKRDSSTAEHLYQTDKSNPAGTDTWDADRVKSELRSKGVTPYNSVSDVSISADFGSGRSTSVNISGDAGGTSFSASEFKDRFNLRAPANIQIVGPLFNVEKR